MRHPHGQARRELRALRQAAIERAASRMRAGEQMGGAHWRVLFHAALDAGAAAAYDAALSQGAGLASLDDIAA